MQKKKYTIERILIAPLIPRSKEKLHCIDVLLDAMIPESSFECGFNIRLVSVQSSDSSKQIMAMIAGNEFTDDEKSLFSDHTHTVYN